MFVDTNVFMYAVGRHHPLKDIAVEFFATAQTDHIPLFTSTEVVQELLHTYLPAGRLVTLSDAMSLVFRSAAEVWPLERDDVMLAWRLHEDNPGLSARDLCHLASCRRRGVSDVMTFDESLRGAFSTVS